MSDLLGQCGYCGSLLYSGDRICPHCGAGIELHGTTGMDRMMEEYHYGASSAPTDGYWGTSVEADNQEGIWDEA